jgi:CRP/FNR family transcriptional regulator, cyclic AMP receptor protein
MSMIKSHKIDFRILDRPDVPVTHHAAGAAIVNKGDPAQEMFLVRKGRVSIELNGKTVEEIGPGGIFGEMALIDHAPRSGGGGGGGGRGGVAVEASEIIPIDERLFVILVQDAPYFALDVMRVLTDRIRQMNQWL